MEIFLNKLAREQALKDLNRRKASLQRWRKVLLHAVNGHGIGKIAELCDLTNLDDVVAVLSRVAAIQSWVRAGVKAWVKKKDMQKIYMEKACEEGIVELQESWKVDRDPIRHQYCRLAADSLKWSDCEVVRDVASCWLSQPGKKDQARADGEDPYAEWGECRLFKCLSDRSNPVKDRLRVLQEVERGVELEYKAAARKFLIVKLPGVLWWWDLQSEPRNARDTARKLKEEKKKEGAGLSRAVDLLKALKETDATVARLATEGHSIAIIAGRCNKTGPDIREILSEIASRKTVIPFLPKEQRYARLTACWER